MSGAHKQPMPDYAEAPETPSGVHRALVKTQKQIKWGSIIAAFSLVGIIAGGVLAVIGIARAEAQTVDAGTKEELKGVAQRVTLLEQGQLQQRQDTHETQADIRELYRVVQSGRRSERLEQPPVTPGPRDGGQ